jgi:hypothetical protein
LNPLFITFAVMLVVAQFILPRKIAFAPLIIAVCHFENIPVLELGAAFSTCKLVILAGLFRAARESTLVWSKHQPLDILIGLWAGWMFISGFAHHPEDHNPITIRLSIIYDFAGSYLYARAFIKNQEDFIRYIKCMTVVVGALAFMVIYEVGVHQNIYELIAGGDGMVTIRESRVRAAGPFAHPILLGTFAATSMILMFPLWLKNRRWAVISAIACSVIVLFSASSGPIVTLFSGLLAMAVWHWRTSVGWIRRIVIVSFVILQVAMDAPIWFLMARIDLAGGSTGWHRAQLISTAFSHLDEWWLVGTDYTRHWMPYGVNWSKYQADITNYYLSMGVNGGLPLMLLFIAILIKAFQLLGCGMQPLRNSNDPNEFILWSVGAALFSHCFTFLSVSYFDQSNVPFGMLLGVIAGICVAAKPIGNINLQMPA